MKRILFISECYPDAELPQNCIFIEQQAKGLISKGNIVDVMVPKHVKKYSNNNNSKYTKDNINVTLAEYKLSTLNKFIYFGALNFEAILKINLTKNKYDVVSVHLLPDILKKIVIKVCKQKKIKVILHYHGLNVWQNYFSKHPIYEKYLAQKRKRMLRKADAMIGVSNLVCNEINKKLPNKKTYTVYNGVDTAFFKPSVSVNETSKLQITCVANLIPIKGHSYLIQAFKIISDRHPNKELILNIVGRGTELNRLKKMVQDLNLDDKVIFHGYLKYDSVAKIIQSSDIFVMPSYFESLGCVYLEAMACKVPIIACANQGIGEIVEDGKTGMLVLPRDVNSLVTKLAKLIENDRLRAVVGETGYKEVTEQYTWLKSAEKLNQVYDEIMQGRE